MPFELEALVGHLHIVSGRSIGAPPPGALVEVAPTRAARGRETDTFFALILPSGETTAPAGFYERMSRVCADRYFSSSGSVTAGLRDVFTSLNQDLYEHNASGKRHYEASMLCAVLHGTDLFLGRLGPGVALLRHQGEMQSFPENLGDDEALFTPPLGIHREADVKMTRYSVANGTRLLLADPTLADVEREKLASALAAEDLGAVLVAHQALFDKRLMMMAVEFVPPDAPVALPVREAETTAMIAGAKPTHIVPPASPEVATGLLRDTGQELEIRARRRASSAALGLARAMDTMHNTLDRTLPEPKEGRRPWLSSPAATGAAVLIPVVVVALVVFLWLAGTDVTDFEMCVTEAENTANVARGISSSDVNGTVEAWTAVLTVIERCKEMRADDPSLLALEREGQIIIDRLYQIDRRETLQIASFQNAALTRLVLHGLDLYTLDDRNDLVYRVILQEDGRSAIQQHQIVTLSRGAFANQFVLDDIVDIAWAQDSAGLSQGNVLIAVDRNGVIVEYSPTFLAQGVQRLLTDRWENPVAITLWGGNLYVLDPGANQIWRYQPTGGAYSGAPNDYFDGQDRPNISTAVDFSIHDDGSVYILLAQEPEGRLVRRFFQGEGQNFGFAGFPEGRTPISANGMFLDNSPVGQSLYMVDRSTRTVIETTLGGTFASSYRAYDEALFSALSDVAADVNQQLVYVLSGNSVLAFDRILPERQ